MAAFNPQGCPSPRLQGADAPTSSPTTTCGGSTRMSRERARSAIFNRSHYEEVLVVRVHELVPEARWSTPLRPDQRLRAAPRRRGHDDRQVLPAHRSRRAARAAPGALRRPDEALEVLARRPRGAQALGRLPGGLRGDAASDARPSGRRGTSSRRTASGSATWPSPTILADTIAGAGPAVPAVTGPAARHARRRVDRPRPSRQRLAAAPEERPEDAADDVLAGS